jgi:hypothetical protein
MHESLEDVDIPSGDQYYIPHNEVSAESNSSPRFLFLNIFLSPAKCYENFGPQ